MQILMVWKHTVAWGGREEEQGAAVGAKETVSSFSVTVGIGTPPIEKGCVQGETGGEGRGGGSAVHEYKVCISLPYGALRMALMSLNFNKKVKRRESCYM